MSWVVDCSLAMAWCFEDEVTPRTEALLDRTEEDPPVVPLHWPLELTNVLRTAIRAKTGCATTVGFGPRFLHSTGQLHKGGADNGLFLQITADPTADADIPTENMPFSALERAQALGDYEALAARKRRILRVQLSSPQAIQKLVEVI